MNSNKRANIKSAAQKIQANVIVGASELHDNIYTSISDSFNTNEIVKVKVNRADKTDKTIVKTIGKQIESSIDEVELVDVIGTTIILYRPFKNREKRVDFD